MNSECENKPEPKRSRLLAELLEEILYAVRGGELDRRLSPGEKLIVEQYLANEIRCFEIYGGKV